MPLGDSITGSTCYAKLLSQTFKNGSHSNFQFVGSALNNQSCNGAPNVKSEGHGGYLATYLTTNSPSMARKGTLAELQSWATATLDIVLMHYGTKSSPNYIIDHWTGFNADTDTSDGVHPTVGGAQKMATASYNAVVALGYF
jgi:hypothetical protein